MLALARLLLGPSNATMEYFSLAAAWSTEHCGCASRVSPEMSFPCGKCDPCIRLSAELELCHSSSPRDCICLKPEWNFQWIPKGSYPLLLDRITGRCPSALFPAGQAEGDALPGAGPQSISSTGKWNILARGVSHPRSLWEHAREKSLKCQTVPSDGGRVSSSCLRAAWSRSGPAQPSRDRTRTGPVPSLPLLMS